MKINKVEIDTITFNVIGCAMKVHTKLGCGFQEVIYQRALAIELRRAGIFFEREMERKIYYDDHYLGSRRADFIVENDIMVELKALINFEDANLTQAKNYLVAYKLAVGLLLNFGSKSLQYKRIFNPNYSVINSTNQNSSYKNPLNQNPENL